MASAPRPPAGPPRAIVDSSGPSFAGLFKLLIFHSAWVLSGPVLIVAPLLLALMGRTYKPLLLMLLYSGYRMVIPCDTWPLMLRMLNIDRTPYYKRQRIIFEGATDLKPDSRTLLAFHPHGALCCGWTTAVVSDVMREARVTWLVADILFRLPGIADMLSWCNTRPVNARAMRGHMAKGTNIALLPGGYEEAILFAGCRYRLYLKRRAGFIKLSLENGYAVRPCYSFGEEKTFRTFTPLLNFRLWLGRKQIPALLFTGGHVVLPFYMPRRDIEMAVVIGEPIQLPRIEQPTAEQVEHWHQRYMAELVALFERNKVAMGCPPEAKLEFY